MKLEKWFKKITLPVGFLDDKILVVPTVSSRVGAIHANFRSCVSFLDASSKVKAFQQDLKEDFESSRSLFETISLNEFFAREKDFCKKCVDEVFLWSPVGSKLNYSDHAYLLIPEIEIHFRRLEPTAEVGYTSDLYLAFPPSYALSSYFDYFKTLKALKDEVRARLFTDRVSSVANLRLTLESFVRMFLETVEPFANKGFLSETNDFSEASLKTGLVDSTDVVIFDSSMFNLVEGEKRDAGRYQHLFEKIIFSPSFNVGKFTVLPYLEFEAFKILVNMTNSNVYYTENFISLENNVTVSFDDNFSKVFETMKSLFDESNETLNNFVSLYDVAVNV